MAGPTATDTIAAFQRRAVVDALDAMVSMSVVDEGGRIVYANDRWCETSGIDRDRVVGFHWTSIMHPDDVALTVERARAVLRRGVPVSYEARVVPRADGVDRWLRFEVSPLSTDDGVPWWIVVAIDTTAHKQAEQERRHSERRLAALVDHLRLGVHLSDEQGRVLAVNPAFLAVVGIDGNADDLVGRVPEDGTVPFGSFLADPGRDLARCLQMAAEPGGASDERFALANGRTIAVDFVPTEVAGDDRGRLWLVRDITEEISNAAQREHLLEIERRHNARLSELDELKSHLVSSVSHELRTPLTSIVSFTELLREGLGTEPVDRLAEYVDVVARNTDRLLRLVDELLLVDRLESGTAEMEADKVDIAEIVQQAVSSMRPTAEATGISLVLEAVPGPLLVADADRLGQLVDNLLSNAVKFTPAGGRVSVTVRPAGDGWRLEVADTGIGIPRREQVNVFERFFRASNARRHAVPGSGLGLAIVRQVAERHGGDVEVRSTEGSGTVVVANLRGLAGDGVPATGGQP